MNVKMLCRVVGVHLHLESSLTAKTIETRETEIRERLNVRDKWSRKPQESKAICEN